MTPALVVAGNLVVDDVVFEDGTTRLGQAGGAALYAALGAAVWGVEVGIASVVGGDYPEEVLRRLPGKGIDLAGVRRIRGPGLRIWLLYEGRRRQILHRLDAPDHAGMSPVASDLPSSWTPNALHIAPMPLSVQFDWLDRAGDASACLHSLDPFDLVDARSCESVRSAFHRADLALLSEDELLLEAALEEPESCLARLATPPEDRRTRLGRILLKRGARGGLVYDCASGAIRSWPGRARTVIDATGAGDAFAGGLLAGLLQQRSLDEALEWGVVSASFALQGHGAEALLGVGPLDCRARSREWFRREPAS